MSRRVAIFPAGVANRKKRSREREIQRARRGSRRGSRWAPTLPRPPAGAREIATLRRSIERATAPYDFRNVREAERRPCTAGNAIYGGSRAVAIVAVVTRGNVLPASVRHPDTATNLLGHPPVVVRLPLFFTTCQTGTLRLSLSANAHRNRPR